MHSTSFSLREHLVCCSMFRLSCPVPPTCDDSSPYIAVQTTHPANNTAKVECKSSIPCPPALENRKCIQGQARELRRWFSLPSAVLRCAALFLAYARPSRFERADRDRGMPILPLWASGTLERSGDANVCEGWIGMGHPCAEDFGLL
jgi:hypothetical protein